MERTPSAKVSERDVWELQVCVAGEQVSMQGGAGLTLKDFVMELGLYLVTVHF